MKLAICELETGTAMSTVQRVFDLTIPRVQFGHWGRAPHPSQLSD